MIDINLNDNAKLTRDMPQWHWGTYYLICTNVYYFSFDMSMLSIAIVDSFMKVNR